MGKESNHVDNPFWLLCPSSVPQWANEVSPNVLNIDTGSAPSLRLKTVFEGACLGWGPCGQGVDLPFGCLLLARGPYPLSSVTSLSGNNLSTRGLVNSLPLGHGPIRGSCCWGAPGWDCFAFSSSTLSRRLLFFSCKVFLLVSFCSSESFSISYSSWSFSFSLHPSSPSLSSRSSLPHHLRL